MSTERIAEFIVNTSYEHMPVDAIQSAKKAILDCLGVTLAGVTEPASRLVAQWVKEQQARVEASVIGWGFGTSAALAALANGTTAHVLDYDDVSLSWSGHPTVALLPAILALGERDRSSGRELVEAYIVGYEVGGKVGAAVGGRHYELGWHNTSTLGSLGAAAAAAKLLKLGRRETQMALGIAASLASGLRENFGTMTKSLHVGHAGFNGVTAALLAQKGFTAAPDIIEAPQGFAMVLGGGEGELGELGLGSPFDIVSPGVALKPYPVCRGAHPSIDALLYLRARYNFKAEDVDGILCRVGPTIPQLLIHHRPRTGLEAKFSMEYCLGRALLEGELRLKHLSDEEVRDPKVQALFPRIGLTVSPELAPGLNMHQEVAVRLKDGRELSHTVDTPRGEPSNPMTWEEIGSKFRECASFALDAEKVEQIMEMVSDVGSVVDVSELAGLVSRR